MKNHINIYVANECEWKGGEGLKNNLDTFNTTIRFTTVSVRDDIVSARNINLMTYSSVGERLKSGSYKK